MSNHSYSKLFYHLVWSTQDRSPLIIKEFRRDLFDYIGKMILKKDLHPIAIGGVEDHVHILLQKKPKFLISEVVCYLKANPSRFMRVKFNPDFAWQGGYSAFTVDRFSLEKIKNYILKQEEHHKKKSLDFELRSF